MSVLQTDRVVVITGAAGGIGSVLVDRFLDNGDTVFATDVDEDTLGVWRDGRIDDEADSRLITAAADISTEDDCTALADVARDRADRVDVLVNCAGYFPITPFEELSLEEWRQVIDINLTGTFLLTRAFLPLLKESDAGRIINFGSGSIFDGTPGQSHYVGAKAGVLGFSRSLAREVGDYGITVNVVTPGLTVTEAVRDHLSSG